ncbi:MAG: SigB/SigF/SigG family RNA polymerase sigma factor [Firmicutes bacterium]|jgi:RNA polymerase sigma-B factor|nr:SigB/SigF/SigG family RNA polymerase sigma factor [Bacillota bacterium]
MTDKSSFALFRQTKDIALRNKIVEDNLYMVEILIRKYMNKGVDYDDLYQVGAMALVNAVERFDPDKGFEFSSFATPTILGEIRKYFRDKEWAMKVPRQYKELATMIPEAKEKLFAKLGRTPTPTEIATHMGIPLDELLTAMESAKAYSAQSLNATFDESGDEGEGAVLEKFLAVKDKGFESVELTEVIRTVIASMSERERRIFTKRYIENMTQSDIAEELGVSQMTISRIEKEIRRKFADELHK